MATFKGGQVTPWRSNLGAGMSNPPITYQLDGKQYIVVAANDTMYGFAMYPKK